MAQAEREHDLMLALQARVAALEAAVREIEALTDDPKEPDVWHAIVNIHQIADTALVER
jgi:hypothetical protein